MSKRKQKTSATIDKQVRAILDKARREPRFQSARERDALIDAIRFGQTEIAHALLDHGVDPNSTDSKRRSPLWYSVHWGRPSLTRDLVKRGARLPDDVLMGPVHDHDEETIRLLIRHGANVNCVAPFTRYCLHSSLKEVLLTEAIRCVKFNEGVDQYARSARADLPARKRRALKPIKSQDYEQIPLLLIKAGANVNRLAFEYAVFDGFIRTTFGLAAHTGLTRTVKAMLKAGADVDQRDTWGGTALFDAAHEGQLDIVKILLAAGANPKLKRKDGFTAASIARERGFSAVADLIEKRK